MIGHVNTISQNQKVKMPAPASRKKERATASESVSSFLNIMRLRWWLPFGFAQGRLCRRGVGLSVWCYAGAMVVTVPDEPRHFSAPASA